MLNNDTQETEVKKLERSDNIQVATLDILDIGSIVELETLLSENPKLNVVLDFWAEWCGSCKEFAPIFQKLYEEYGEHYIFVKINVEKDKRISWKYNITSIPTCIIMKNGDLVYMHAGIIDYPKIKKILDSYKSP